VSNDSISITHYTYTLWRGDQTPIEIAGKENIFKELGNLQQKVLFFLAENPDQHKQAIQKGISHPTDQYGSISKAVDSLEELGFIDSKLTKSQKNVEIKLFKCTDEGVLYALSRNPLGDILKILDSYKEQVEFCKQFRALYDVWGQKQMALFLKDLGEFLPMVHTKGIEYAAPFLLMKFAKQFQTLDPKTKKKNVKAAINQFPKTKEMLKEMQDNIKELL
jgi:DNA-binding PadR family transcriptional regulator